MTCKHNIQTTNSDNIDILCTTTPGKIKEMITTLIVVPKKIELTALYISGRHNVNGYEATYGCVVRFPDNNSIYVTEENFKRLFDITEEKD